MNLPSEGSKAAAIGSAHLGYRHIFGKRKQIEKLIWRTFIRKVLYNIVFNCRCQGLKRKQVIAFNRTINNVCARENSGRAISL
jgi:hypothetical protein